MTGAIKRDIRQREYYLELARKYNSHEDWTNSQCARNIVLVENSQKDSPRKKQENKSISVDGELCVDNKKVAYAFSHFFCATSSV